MALASGFLKLLQVIIVYSKVRITVLEILALSTQWFHLQEREKPHLQEAAHIPDSSHLHNQEWTYSV